MRVITGSRLHFGLLNGEQTTDPWSRPFGGVGLMITEPRLEMKLTPDSQWSAAGPLGDRAMNFCRLFVQTTGKEISPHRITIAQAPPEHAGFGVGTQLGMAVAYLLSRPTPGENANAADLAQSVCRGKRSGLGVHGFLHGGFLVDAGKRHADALAPLAARVSFPEAWRVVVVLPMLQPGIHGEAERRAMALARSQAARAERLCRMTLQGLLPALLEKDVDLFGETLHAFNALAGELFAPVQGGTYASPRLDAAVDFIRRRGIAGVGQSSWGPAVFAVVGDVEQAAWLKKQVEAGLDPAAVFVASGLNRGADVEFGE